MPTSIWRSTAQCGAHSAPAASAAPHQPRDRGQARCRRIHRTDRRPGKEAPGRQWPRRGYRDGAPINKQQIETSTRYTKIAQDEGAALLQGGVALAEGTHSKGHFFAPTIFAKVQPKMRIAQEEVFGPVLSVIECDGVDDAIRIANGIEYVSPPRSTRAT